MPPSATPKLFTWWQDHANDLPHGALVISDGHTVPHQALTPHDGPGDRDTARQAKAAGASLAGQLTAPLQWVGVCLPDWEGTARTLLVTRTKAHAVGWIMLGGDVAMSDLEPIGLVRKFYVNPLRLGALGGTSCEAAKSGPRSDSRETHDPPRLSDNAPTTTSPPSRRWRVRASVVIGWSEESRLLRSGVAFCEDL